MLVAEVLIHHLDTLRMLLGPLKVTAAGLSRTYSEMAGEDGAVIQMKTERGAAVTVFASFAAIERDALRVLAQPDEAEAKIRLKTLLCKIEIDQWAAETDGDARGNLCSRCAGRRKLA